MRRPDLPSVFVDADVLITGSASTAGASHLILQLGELGLIDVVSSDQARREAERNIARKVPEASQTFDRLIRSACRPVPTPPTEEVARHRGEADEEVCPSWSPPRPRGAGSSSPSTSGTSTRARSR